MWDYGNSHTIRTGATLKALCLHVVLRARHSIAHCVSTIASFHPHLEPLYRYLAKMLVFAIYNIRSTGFDSIPATGPVLLISNHLSYVDGLIINALCKRRVRFVIDNTIYRLPLIHYFMQLNRAIPISGRKELVNNALNDITEGLKNGDVICIFPEGRLTYTGFMSHFRPGIEWIIRKSPAPIYPIILDGLWGSIFSRKYRGSFLRFLPRSFRRKVCAVCGDVILPENVTIDQLHLVMLELRTKLPKA